MPTANMPDRGEDWRALRSQAQLVELAPEAILVREVGTGTILFWNHGAEELYGWTRAEALGQVSHELLRTEFPRPLEAIERELAEHGRWRARAASWCKRPATDVASWWLAAGRSSATRRTNRSRTSKSAPT
jgi:PAS domain-containing protein